MNNDEIAIRMSTVNKVLQVAQQCADESKKGWFVRMSMFWNAMDAFNIGSREVREVLALLQARMHVITFLDGDGHITGISVTPQWFRCWHCNGLLNMQDGILPHLGDCWKRQQKIERNRKLA